MVKIPEGWLDYSKIGKPIRGVPIVAFKTPLCKNFHRPYQNATGIYVEEDQQLTPQQLDASLKEIGYSLAVVVDLTFTFRYYSGQKELVEDLGIKYEKVKCPGQVIPDDAIVTRVANIFNDVIRQHGMNSKKIAGIHCTHGLNRTGYIVCRYLVEWHGYTPDEAISLFNEARGHNIERENYIEDIKSRTPGRRYGEWVANINNPEYNEFDSINTETYNYNNETQNINNEVQNNEYKQEQHQNHYRGNPRRNHQNPDHRKPYFRNNEQYQHRGNYRENNWNNNRNNSNYQGFNRNFNNQYPNNRKFNRYNDNFHFVSESYRSKFKYVKQKDNDFSKDGDYKEF